MKQIIKNYLSPLIILAGVISFSSCTKLEADLKNPLLESPPTTSGAPTPPSLSIVYEQLNQLSGNGNWFSMEEQTTDEMIEPTRGTDWDDFGTNRKLHLHSWDASHDQVNNTWNGLNGALFLTTLVAEAGSAQDQPQAKFLRAYFSYIVCDLYGQVQHRPATAQANVIPEVFTRSEAIDFIISELEAVKDQLPTYNHDNRNLATKEAAEFLLAKAYLNKAVFKQDPTSPAGPFAFDAGDMDKVIQYCNDIAANPNLGLSNSYWDNFKWDNGALSTENIFVRQKSGGLDLRWATFMGFHYNMAPSGWNGFCTLSDFYNTFDDNDVRKGIDLPGYTDQAGARVGFLIGQQRGPSTGKIGDPIVDLKDRSGNPLVFTPDVSLYFSTETKGIRTNKYPMDPATINDGGGNSQNEFVMFRFADVRLMKAEAILRGGNDPMSENPANIVNGIRSKRGVSDLASVDLDALLAERGKELYCEGWRRNDLVRYGKFNDPVQERSEPSDPSRVVFPIPNIALSSNPNLSQNFGY